MSWAATEADKSQVADYINRLDINDGPEIAKLAPGDPHCWYEEVPVIHNKSGMNAEAMETLMTNSNSMERAKEFAARGEDTTGRYQM